MAKDYYNALGVSKNAPLDEIKKAFRKLAHKYHPDKKGGDEMKFKEVSEAYSVLSDEKKRSEYDAYGRVFNEGGEESGGAQGFGGFSAQGGPASSWDFSGFSQGQQDFDFGDIFSELFRGAKQHVQRGRDISIDLEFSFKDSIFGVERKILLTKTSSCKICKGSGAKEGAELETCKKCNGNGKIHETKQSLLGAFSSVRVCDGCAGRGTVPKEKCKTCHGMGVLKQEEEIIVSIPAGIDNGEMIRLSGRGEAIYGGVPGDLYIKIHVRQDPVFCKEGANLVRVLNIKLSDALLGGIYSVSTLDGDIKVTIPKEVTHGEVLRIRGKGVPVEKNRRGDLLIKLNIILPTKLSKKAKKLIEDLKNEGI